MKARRRSWRDGRVARFDDVGLFLFKSHMAAQAFVAAYDRQFE